MLSNNLLVFIHQVALPFVSGLNGKNNLEKAWCDVVVDILVEIRKELWPFTTFGRKEKDDAKFVSLEIHNFYVFFTVLTAFVEREQVCSFCVLLLSHSIQSATL